MRGTVYATLSLLILVASVTSAFYVLPVKAQGTIYIRADGSIEPAGVPISTTDNITYNFYDDINSSSGVVVQKKDLVIDGNGHTIRGDDSTGRIFGKGFYLSGIKNVTIKNTRIEDFDQAFYLSSGNNSIVGNTVAESCRFGIWLNSSSNNVIRENNVTANVGGLAIQYSDNNSIVGNDIENCGLYGIRINSSFNNSVNENKIADTENFGIILYLSSNNSVSGNTFTNNGLQVDDSYLNSVENNIVNGKPLVYLEGVADRTVGDAGQVILVSCSKIKVENLSLSRANVGMQLLKTNGTTISGNNIWNNTHWAIRLDSCHDNRIDGNNLTTSFVGIMLSGSSNTINRNNIKANDIGISISGFAGFSSNNTISNNNITANNDDAVGLIYSDNNSIVGNNIRNNFHIGIRIVRSSYNRVSGNNITDNMYGITFENFYLKGANVFWHNSFVNNGRQIQFFSSGEYADVWDDGYPSGGNYWSDHSGVDLYSGPFQNLTGSDGIIDSPYIIDSNNTDRYPLMPPPTFPGDVNRNGVVDIYDIVLAVASYGSKPGDPNWNYDADQAKPYGIINMLDLVTIASQYGKHYL